MKLLPTLLSYTDYVQKLEALFYTAPQFVLIYRRKRNGNDSYTEDDFLSEVFMDVNDTIH
jgi:hypothetical protein